ncbi:alpha-tectorin-like [Glandiceps talaboti]
MFEEYSICSGWGDPHYTTFDNEKYDFQGDCTYMLAENCVQEDNIPSFKVTADNRKSSENARVSFTREVTVSISGMVITMMEDKKVYVEGVRITPPCEPADGVVILRSGALLNLYTDFGLSVKWNGKDRFEIKLPESFMNKTCGLCGNYDGLPEVEYTGDGTLSTVGAEFGNSWAVDSVDCDGNVNDVSPCDDRSPEELDSIMNICDVILDNTTGLFIDCHGEISPQPYYDACVYDLCALHPDDSFKCDSAELYAADCASIGIIVDWRTESFCPMECPQFSTYSKCSTACPPTCADPKADQSCDQVCVEGCKCNDGYLLDGDMCVEENQCGCTKDGYYYSVGSESVNLLCTERCSCNAGGNHVCTGIACDENAGCEIRDGVRDCYCNDGYLGDGISCINDRPYDVSVQQVSSSSITIIWKLQIEVERTMVQYRPEGSNGWTVMPPISASQLLFVLQGLESNSSYEIQVIVVRLDGTRGESDILIVTTCLYGFEGVGCVENMREKGAFNLLIEIATSNSISFSWSFELVTVRKLTIEYSIMGSGSWTPAAEITDTEVTRFVLTSLQINTYFDIRIVVELDVGTINTGVTYIFKTCPANRRGRNCEDVYAICSAYGDPHYITFDGLRYDYQGDCEYILVKDCQQDTTAPPLPVFEVIANNIKNSPNARVSFTREVTMKLFGVNMVLLNGGDVQIEGVYVNLPVQVSINVTGYTNGLDRVYNTFIRSAGRYVVLQTDFDVDIYWNKRSSVQITVPPMLLNATCGLCGTLDDNPFNDLMTPQGRIAATVTEFGNSWVYNKPECQSDVIDVNPCDSVTSDLNRTAHEMCSILTNPAGPFLTCHSFVDPEEYYYTCVYDLCASLPEDDTNACDSIELYAQTCTDRGGTHLQWRTPDFCRMYKR